MAETVTGPASGRKEPEVPELTSEEVELVHGVARRIVSAGLESDDSLFTPGRAVWTAGNVDELYRRFVQRPLEGAGSFLDKLRQQLGGGGQEAIQLAAELVYLHLLIQRDMTGATKRRLVQTVLAIGRLMIRLPDDLDAALGPGLANGGVAMKTLRWRQLAWLVEFLRSWKALGPEARSRALADPWAFKQAAFAVPVGQAYSQRNALLHLVFPDTFEAILSRDHKTAIVQAFADRIGEPSDDVDRDLLAIRRSLEAEHVWPGSFYWEPLVGRWRPAAEEPVDGEGEAATADDGPDRDTVRGWLVRGANVGGRDLVPTWLREGYSSIGFPDAGPLDPDATHQAIVAAVAEGYGDAGPGTLRSTAGNIERFLRRMSVGDLIVTVRGSRVYVGVVAGEPTWHPDAERGERRQRKVAWANPDAPIDRGRLSRLAQGKLRGQTTVSDLGETAREFAELAKVDIGTEQPPPARTPPPTEALLAPATEALAAELLLPRAWLEEAIDLLREKGQVVFYGPPGTGKTYVARALCEHLTADGGLHDLVQFHPSYAYEDFFEGFRPRAAVDGSGTITFELVPGPLRRLAASAEGDPEHPYLLVIDELNRANLAKVFGELYFLLEYREETISLQYSDQPFTLPRNLFVIGTMNTADRSIALVDAAMRRRFAFVPFFPGEEPIAGLLRRWLQRQGLPLAAADLLDELNRRLGDGEIAVGPSYLMTRRAATTDGLDRIWRSSILPLLEEHFYGTETDVAARFGLPALRAAGSAPAGQPQPETVEPDEP
jgi:5-methylcytosine-specific restriction enzyme B